MASEARPETDASGLADALNRVGLNNENGNEPRLGPDGEAAPRTEEEYAQSQLTLRAIVSSKEAGVIIGKAGKNVADLRDETGVKAGVSKVVQGVHDRVLTVTGGLEGISKAYAIVAKGLLEGAPQMGMGGVISTNGTHRKFQIDVSSSCESFPLIASPFLLAVPHLDNSDRADATFCCSNTSAYLSSPDGHYHWSPRAQDQTDTRCLRGPHGGSEGNVAAIDRANR